ncbi:uncharacterized protein VTP21DRAFT_1223 [Calcarisporiella thermophila]|uniref:uncharacterized protein n=1 Tax=Calcarisporiella thermophila TaxID=911321 RepID=UPI003743AB8B
MLEKKPQASSLIGHRIDSGRIELTALLGEGAYGTVYLGTHLQTGAKFAVKRLSTIQLTPRRLQFLFSEMTLHACVSAHPSILRLEQVIQAPDALYMVLEYAPEGDLFTAIADKGRFIGDDDAAKNVFLQIVDAVSYCHSRGVFHRDLKTENVLVFDNGSRVKLADFGLATSNRASSEFGCGSHFYYSPECLGSFTQRRFPYNTASNDVWSLGIILINLLTGHNPWRQASSFDPAFCSYLRDPRQFLATRLPQLSNEAIDLLTRVLIFDPTQRLSLDELRVAVASAKHLTVPVQKESTPKRSLSAGCLLHSHGAAMSLRTSSNSSFTDFTCSISSSVISTPWLTCTKPIPKADNEKETWVRVIHEGVMI